MDLGLKGDGVSLCGICQETLDDHTIITDSAGSSVFGQQQEILVTLPCVHMFHDSCLAEWLQSNLGSVHWDCPTCRGRVHLIRWSPTGAGIKLNFKTDSKKFLLSGFCPKCIIWFMERDRNQLLPMLNENLEQMSVGSSVGQMQTGNVYANISQGGRC